WQSPWTGEGPVQRIQDGPRDLLATTHLTQGLPRAAIKRRIGDLDGRPLDLTGREVRLPFKAAEAFVGPDAQQPNGVQIFVESTTTRPDGSTVVSRQYGPYVNVSQSTHPMSLAMRPVAPGGAAGQNVPFIDPAFDPTQVTSVGLQFTLSAASAAANPDGAEAIQWISQTAIVPIDAARTRVALD